MESLWRGEGEETRGGEGRGGREEGKWGGERGGEEGEGEGRGGGEELKERKKGERGVAEEEGSRIRQRYSSNITTEESELRGSLAEQG